MRLGLGYAKRHPTEDFEMHMKAVIVSALASLSLQSTLSTAGEGWTKGYENGGITYYAIRNGAGDLLKLDCPDAGSVVRGASLTVILDGMSPEPNSFVTVVADGTKQPLPTDNYGDVVTDDHMSSMAFQSAWSMMRAGRRLVVRLSDGQSATFSAENAGAVIPEDPCATAFNRAVAEMALKEQQTAQNTADSTCKIEDWTYSEKAGSIYLNGSTTCKSGKLIYRLYDGETDEFIASDFTYIDGFAFQSYTDGRMPKSIKIKYVIEER